MKELSAGPPKKEKYFEMLKNVFEVSVKDHPGDIQKLNNALCAVFDKHAEHYSSGSQFDWGAGCYLEEDSVVIDFGDTMGGSRDLIIIWGGTGWRLSPESELYEDEEAFIGDAAEYICDCLDFNQPNPYTYDKVDVILETEGKMVRLFDESDIDLCAISPYWRFVEEFAVPVRMAKNNQRYDSIFDIFYQSVPRIMGMTPAISGLIAPVKNDPSGLRFCTSLVVSDSNGQMIKGKTAFKLRQILRDSIHAALKRH